MVTQVAGVRTPGCEKVYLTCAQTAKYVRRALADAFPGVKFSVRSDTYSMGASIRVHWTDGPTPTRVEKVTHRFEGADFDGMIDLKTYNTHWVGSDGTVGLARAEGTVGSRGVIPAVSNPVPEGAILVHFGADFIFCSREITDFEGQRTAAAALIRERCHCEGEPPADKFGDQYVANLAEAMLYGREEGEDLAGALDRIVLNR